MLAGANDDNRKSLSNDLNAVANVPLNLYTISEMLQKILEKPLEKKSGRNFDLQDGKTLIYFIDDMNMPEGISPENEYLLSPPTHSHFADGIGDQKCMYVRSWSILQTLLNDAMKLYSEFPRALNLVLFEDAMSRVFQINRILEHPGDNALLVGVDGSDQPWCLVHQSLFISSLEIEFTLPSYGISDFKVDKTTLMAKWPKDALESKSLRLLRGLVKDDETLSSDRNTCVMLQTMKKLQINLKNYHPVQLLNELKPGLRFYVTVISNPPADILVRCIVNGSLIEERASTKKAAQKKIAVLALKSFYGIRFNS